MWRVYNDKPLLCNCNSLVFQGWKRKIISIVVSIASQICRSFVTSNQKTFFHMFAAPFSPPKKVKSCIFLFFKIKYIGLSHNNSIENIEASGFKVNFYFF